jgi:hypothetical protein
MHLFLAWRFKFTPLNKGILFTLLLMLALFGINYLIPQLGHPVLDTALRCLILGTLYISIAYWIKIAPEINEQLDGLLNAVKRNFRK